MSRLFLGLALLLALAAPARAITVCHDYVLYVVTGQDLNRSSVATLRARLRALGYKRFPFSNAATLPRAQKILKPGDVIIIGDDHSGVMKAGGIWHFIQVYGASGTVYAPTALPAPQAGRMGGLYQGDTLLQMLDRRFSKAPRPVEVWRKQ